MCGISGIILKGSASFDLKEKVLAMNNAIRHRGPDGQGFLLAGPQHAVPYSYGDQRFSRSDLNYIPKEKLPASAADSKLAFGHRRLSIIDLSDSGHQPMCDQQGRYWIVFNGEIYNYIELREELKKLGHTFISESDTEVILAAYAHWGTDCVQKLDGMWSFCIYDVQKQICFASRDRFGVKPFYYASTKAFLAFASEQKAFIRSGIVPFGIHKKALHDYLVNDLLENETENFFEGISELMPGHNLVYDLRSQELSLSRYYHLKDHISLKNDSLSEKELVEKIRAAFDNSVRLRLRSDVEIGTCLSGGIDSSALAATIARMTDHPLHCFTSVFRGQVVNEEKFADLVARQIGAKHHKTEPSLEGFEQEVNALIYSQDIPIWSTSTYAQFKVMELAKEQKIKVVLDGQGADELFGGYYHHFAAKWSNLLAKGKFVETFRDIRLAGKSIPNPFSFYLKERVKQHYYVNGGAFNLFFKPGFIKSFTVKNPLLHFSDVNEQLLDDIYRTRLKSFLKCEDRCGMWHGVESRTPFSDDTALTELLFSFDGNKKIKDGVSKHLLREAVKDRLPVEIYQRYDKRGFETPMQEWVSRLKPLFLKEIKEADFDFLDYSNFDKWDVSNSFHYKLLFKLFVLSRWKKLFSEKETAI